MVNKFEEFVLLQTEGIRSEFPGMFATNTYTPETVPGFEDGTIDPEDNDIYDGESDKERYKDFLKITKERNIKETNNEIIINLKRLCEDFYMTIYNSSEYIKEFLNPLLLGMYISDGFGEIYNSDDYDDVIIEGIIEDIRYMFDDYSTFVDLKLKNSDFSNILTTNHTITLDKVKSEVVKYNL